MAKTIAPLLPSTTEFLQRFGERLRLVRLRRRLTAKQVAERAGMAPMTLRSLERGGAGVTMGAYLAVMQVLGIEKDIDLLGAADPLGRELQDARLTAQGKPSVRTESSVSGVPVKRRLSSQSPGNPKMDLPPLGDGSGQRRDPGAQLNIAAADATHDRPAPAKTRTQSRKRTGQWVEKSGFTSAQTLVDLIDVKGTTQKKRR